jgi:DNA-binding NarL/FixJ family response regulator
MTLRVLIVDDETDARELLAEGLTARGYHCAVAASLTQAKERLDEGWDAAVIDIVLGDGNGLDLLATIRSSGMPCACIVMSAFTDKQRAICALNQGADHLLEKPFSVAELAEVLQTLNARHGIERILQQIASSGELTERETEVLAQVLRGLSNRQIAHQLGIGIQSVKNIILRFYRKLGVGSRSELLHRYLAP